MKPESAETVKEAMDRRRAEYLRWLNDREPGEEWHAWLRRKAAEERERRAQQAAAAEREGPA